MNPTTIPDEEIWPGSRRFVAMPPDGDMTGEGGISPVEMLQGHIQEGLPFQAVRFVATPEEAQRLAAGEPVWLVYFSPLPMPVAIEFKEDILGEESDTPS